VCGIQTNIEGDQEGGDDTALNDVILFCCSVEPEELEIIGK